MTQKTALDHQSNQIRKKAEEREKSSRERVYAGAFP